MQNKELIISNLNKINVDFDEDLELKFNTYFMYGGTVNIFIKPSSLLKFEKVVRFLNDNKIEFVVTGNTSNLIFLRNIVYNVIVSTIFINSIHLEENSVTCGAGVMIPDLARIALLHNVAGFEGLEGIPGTIGGGVFMNAGAYGSAISDNLISVKALSLDGSIFELNKEQCDFKKRHSIFKKDPTITIISAKFSLNKSKNYANIAHKMEVYHIARHSYQEFVYPNLGSMLTLNSCIYHEVFKSSLERKVLFILVRAVFTNKLIKFFKRKRPSNEILNRLFVKYENLVYPTSHKSINILINNGNVDDFSILDHINKMERIAKNIGEIENELVLKSIYSIDKNLEKKLKSN